MDIISTTAAAAVYIVFAMTFFQMILKLKEFLDKETTTFQLADRRSLWDLIEMNKNMKESLNSLKRSIGTDSKKIRKIEGWVKDIKRHTSPSHSLQTACESV